MVGSSMMMASFGFMIYAISPVYSNSEKEKTEIKNQGISNNQKLIQVPLNEDGSVNVKLSQEQIKEIRETQGSAQRVVIEGWAKYEGDGYVQGLENNPLPVQ